MSGTMDIGTLDLYPQTAIYGEFNAASDEKERFLRHGLLVRPNRTVASPFDLTDEVSVFSIRDSEPYIEPGEFLTQTQAASARLYLDALATAIERVRILKSQAKEEGHLVSPDSEKDLVNFLHTTIFTRRPFLALLDNGNLRAVWKNNLGEQIGLQFRGGKQVQFVLFARRDRAEFARVSGRDRLADIPTHLKNLRLQHLLRG